MISSSTPFPLATVSTDTTTLREIYWTLSSFGYDVVTFSDWSEHAPWQRTVSPSLLLLDARDKSEIESVLARSRANPYTYRIALYDAESSTDPDFLLELGADDFVRSPLNTGELLACLRRGERRLEFEKRLNLATTFDHQAGIANKRGFIRQLERKHRDRNDTNQGGLIVFGIDFLDTIRAQHGNLAVEEANSLLTKLLHDELLSEDLRGILKEGVYAVLLPGRTISEAILFAAEISGKLDDLNTTSHLKKPRLSVSGVVLEWPTEESAEHTVNRMMAAHSHAIGLGGNQIVLVDEVEQQYSTWKEQSFFDQNVNAQHIMEALPLVLPINSTSSTPKNGLGIFTLNSGQLLPKCVPVVDDSGHLLGTVEAESLRTHGNDILTSLEVHLNAINDIVKGNSGLPEVVATMEQAENDYLLVVENKKPIGYITNETLTAINLDSLDNPSEYWPTGADIGLNSLVVPLI